MLPDAESETKSGVYGGCLPSSTDGLTALDRAKRDTLAEIDEGEEDFHERGLV